MRPDANRGKVILALRRAIERPTWGTRRRRRYASCQPLRHLGSCRRARPEHPAGSPLFRPCTLLRESVEGLRGHPAWLRIGPAASRYRPHGVLRSSTFHPSRLAACPAIRSRPRAAPWTRSSSERAASARPGPLAPSEAARPAV